MAGEKLTDLTALANLATDDLFYVVDASDTSESSSGSSKSSNLLTIADFVKASIHPVFVDTYDANGGTNVTSGAVVQLDTARTITGNDFSLSGGVLTYNESARAFWIDAQVSTYNRTSSNGENTGSATCILTLNSGDKLRLFAIGVNASGPVTTIAESSRLTATNL